MIFINKKDEKMLRTVSEITSLMNIAVELGIKIHHKHTEDKRKKTPMYFANIGNETISPVLNYHSMLCFLFGYKECTIRTKNY